MSHIGNQFIKLLFGGLRKPFYKDWIIYLFLFAIFAVSVSTITPSNSGGSTSKFPLYVLVVVIFLWLPIKVRQMINWAIRNNTPEAKAAVKAKHQEIKSLQAKKNEEHKAEHLEQRAEIKSEVTDKKLAREIEKNEKKLRKLEKSERDRAIREEKKLERQEKRANIKREHAEKKAADLEKYGKVICAEFVGRHRIRLHEKGFISIGTVLRTPPEKLFDFSVSANVSKKTGIGRAAAGVATMGLNLYGSNMRGDIYVSISTDVKSHVLHVDPPTSKDIKASRKLESAAKMLLARKTQNNSDAGSTDKSLADQLNRLLELHAKGALTDTEFSLAKDKLLGS